MFWIKDLIIIFNCASGEAFKMELSLAALAFNSVEPIGFSINYNEFDREGIEEL